MEARMKKPKKSGERQEPNEIGANTPLRLSTAAELGFRYGTMTASRLWREAARGRRVIERIAARPDTSLGNLEPNCKCVLAREAK